MIRYRRWILLLIPAFLLLVIPVFASSIGFLPKAQKYIDQNCSARHLSNQTSLLCYLFFKAGEQDQRLNTLETQGATMSAAIAGLQDKPLPPPLKIEGTVSGTTLIFGQVTVTNDYNSYGGFINADVWAVAHTPFGDINSDPLQGTGQFKILLPSLPATGTVVSVDVFGFWGGRTVQRTFQVQY